VKERLVVLDWLNHMFIATFRNMVAGGIRSGIPVFSHCVMGVDTPPGSGGYRMTITPPLLESQALVWFPFNYLLASKPPRTSNLSRDIMSYTGRRR